MSEVSNPSRKTAVKPTSTRAAVEPTDTALHTRLRRNSSHRRCSSRAISQNET